MGKEIDLIIFAGQSNMAGRGNVKDAPTVAPGTGYEYRAVSDPTQLYPITEPFGANENRGGLSENKKSGSLVSALVRAYHKQTGRLIVGVSAAQGGTTVDEWQLSGVLLPEALNRFTEALNWLESHEYTVAHRWLVWCQGESDGDAKTPKDLYKQKLTQILAQFYQAGVAHTFMIRIGNHRDFPNLYTPIIEAQTEYVQATPTVTMIATGFDQLAKAGLMKDEFHYTQAGYNRVGTEAGNGLAKWVLGEVVK